MTLISPPVTSTSINQSFFIEALGGSQSPISYLDRFPDSVYTKALDSLLVKFMYAIMGPTGVGLLREQYLEARLIIEEGGLDTTELDNLYANAFAFARAAYETYAIDASSDLLSADQRAQILTQDSSFRNRAIDFLKGARGGSTLQGLTLVAKSGANRPVELIENYRSLFDHWTDVPLGLEDVGQTKSVDEVVILPRQNASESTIQTLSISGEPSQGWFSLVYAAGQRFSVLPFTTTNATNGVISVPDASRFPPGVFVTLTNASFSSFQNGSVTVADLASSTYTKQYVESLGGSGTTVNLGGTLMTGNEGQSVSISSTSSSMVLLVGVAQTTPLPFDASAADIQNALQSLPVIGDGNVIVTGGPFPDQDVQVQFVNQLSDQQTSSIIFDISADANIGITTPLTNSGDSTAILPDVVTSTVSYSSNLPTVIAGADLSTLYKALDQTKSMNTLFTTGLGNTDVIRQPVSTSFTSSNNINVIRYETGRSVQWPALDGTHWIEAGAEHEAPTVYGTNSQYQGFHNISSIIAYTEAALTDSGYLAGTTDIDRVYWDSLVGNYSPTQLELYPGLGALNSGNYFNQYLPSNAEAAQPEPLIIGTSGGISVINEIYPVDYMTVQGVLQPAGGLVWASAERSSGIDYLELDLGTAQPVNYIYFEATNKPYSINVAYDLLDQSPRRNFKPVTIVAPTAGKSNLSLNYTATQLWSDIQINFGDYRGEMIYTRFLRIGFTKTPVGTVYQPIGKQGIAYSVEVRNLRVGRNVS